MRPSLVGGEYRTFLLRIWRESDDARACRCSLEDPETGQRRGFDSVEGLLNFLTVLAGQEPRADRSRR